MRSKAVSIAGKEIRVEEKRIGELEKLVTELFPESKGDLTKIDLGKLLGGGASFDLLYNKILKVFPGLCGFSRKR